ncbi:MAG: hypothetical protein ACR2NR_15555 [Solirubrobacteraceae bacterium]
MIGATTEAMLVARVLYGLGLLLKPGRILSVVGGSPDATVCRLARVLGARELTQAMLLARRPTRTRLAIGAAVDLTHSCTMLAVAIDRPAHRGPARASARVGIACALIELIQVGRRRA